jgi:murein L,D-transpeptidase YafK
MIRSGVLGGTMRHIVMGLLMAGLAAGAADARSARSVTHVAAKQDQTAELTSPTAPVLEKADRVVVFKSQHRMVLLRRDHVLDVFTVALGRYPRGHKISEGDQRTPEGSYVLDEKLPKSKFYRAIRISYPNAQDTARARQLGLRPGGRVEIHGQPDGWPRTLNKFDWTDGCIAVTNREMDRVWARVDAGTPIEIYP